MIPNKIKNLFVFVDFLHSNIANFKQYDHIINSLQSLDVERGKLNPKDDFKSKIKYDKIQDEISDKFNILKHKIVTPIREQATRLKICDIDRTETVWNWNIQEVNQLKEDFTENDVKDIINIKKKYIEYRVKTNAQTYFSLSFFFTHLDEILKELFNFFKESNENEFEKFEVKYENASSIEHAVNLFKHGYKNLNISMKSLNKTSNTPPVKQIHLTNNYNDTSKNIYSKIQDWSFFQIYVNADINVNGKIHKNVRQKNNDSILKPTNWEENKETFFNQRMSTYNKSYTITEMIDLELEYIDKLSINNDNYKILKRRYKKLLEDKKQEIFSERNIDNNFEINPYTFFLVPVKFHDGELFTEDSELNPSNWKNKVDDFFAYRMTTYPKGYTEEEKINLEIKKLSKLVIKEEQYEILKDRYKTYLNKKVLQVVKEENKTKLPSLKNCVIIHYGCSDFESDEHNIFWVGAIHHNPNKSYFFENKDEITIIEKLKEFINNNNDKTFIHWSMNSFKFGFKAIEQRYYELTKKGIDLMPYNELDLSEYLKNKYGIYYVPRENGRLNNLAKLNGFSGIQSEVEVINVNDAGNRLELLFSIVQADIQNELKTKSDKHLKHLEHLVDDKVSQSSKYNYAKEKLSEIWLAEPKLSICDFIQKGIDKGMWDQDLNIVTARKSPFGRGKSMLGSIYIAFKGWSIISSIDYKKAGEIFCSVFNINIKETTKEPFKAFSSGNQKIIHEIKRTFNIKNS